ncbi:hypothetical protein CVM52_24925 [Pseudooceanicola lipolyticus]|uniref:HTH merR-type domain-containing protein n=1 Tax=Pseudooceanicola lipolyticus TaxID=2029104 RepID=A0A2M8ITS3_9RHOB|nr:hypothetical protein [Pseudooceanicola lipolyticus]PJE33930.1 hypothetical protein CVM52_24925 [Pseudooceanicola lipolyticus]
MKIEQKAFNIRKKFEGAPLDELLLNSQEVAFATGVEAKSVQNWSTRELIVGHGGGGQRGCHRQFDWQNLMEVACAATLMDSGLSAPADAFRAARHLAHAGAGTTPNCQATRHPGFPYHFELGKTYLHVSGDRGCVMLHTSDTRPSEIETKLGRPVGYISLNVSAVFELVCARLGLHPNTVLDQVYSKDSA